MDYSAVNAKVAGMSAKLLSYDEYADLCGSSSVQAMQAKLKSHAAYSYAAESGARKEERISHARQLFSLLDDDYRKIIAFINDTGIKSYLNCFFIKRNLPVQALTAAADLHYYTNLWKAGSRLLMGTNKSAAQAVNGTGIDMQNLIRIYREKKYYKQAAGSIYKYILPINYKVPPEIIISLTEAENEAAVTAVIKSTCYGAYFSDTQRVEESFHEALSAAHRRAQKKHRNSIAPILYYLYRKETELKNLISIYEGVKYAMAPGEIMGFVRH